MAWPLRRVLAKGVLINTTWNPLGSFRLFCWCLWPFQDCSYQTKPVFEAKELERRLKKRLYDSIWSKEGGGGKRRKSKGVLVYSALLVTDMLSVNVTQWAWIHYLYLSVLYSHHVTICCEMTTKIERPGHRPWITEQVVEELWLGFAWKQRKFGSAVTIIC